MSDLQRLDKLLLEYDKCYGYKPIECEVCGKWNLHSCPVMWDCTKCKKKVCNRDWVNIEGAKGVCADCYAD